MILDEADQMLERGFAESMEEILAESFTESKLASMHVHMLGDLIVPVDSLSISLGLGLSYHP